MSFGQFVRRERQRLSITLRTAAQRVGVDPAYLSRVEAGKVPPSEQLIDRLADLLQCSADELYLLGGKLPYSLRPMIAREPRKIAMALRRVADEDIVESPTHSVSSGQLGSKRAIEDGFPFEEVSEIAELESWRKEIHRPIYHVHKWWALRLGSVFRAAILAAATPSGTSVMELFYKPVRLPGTVVFDPFMGSGTTIGEAIKLGCTAIGRDINPVAYRAVRTALGAVKLEELKGTFSELQRTVGKELRELYRTIDSSGRPSDVLYFFWVKVISCPTCHSSVDLFSRYVFAQNAYPRRKPTARILCPNCGAVFEDRFNASRVTCPACKNTFDPQAGPAKRVTATCTACDTIFPILKTVRATRIPPKHRMFAKLVLREDGEKEYLRIDARDLAAYEGARERLQTMRVPVPHVEIQPGNNTQQILNYCYRHWDELFNDRQLLGLGLLAQAIAGLPASASQAALMTLFSGVLEFNNMFASYKGEGTGAVRHMFSHHILKPERTPIEANIWGTSKSSGSFSTLFRSRLLRAFEYRARPFEIAVERNGQKKQAVKVTGISSPIRAEVLDGYPASGLTPTAVYLSCGSSFSTDIPSTVVDLVVTDPPFFDNVHYSELADFFYVWQELYFSSNGPKCQTATTRSDQEVQDTDSKSFAAKLGSVFKECHRVLKDEGLLVFSYHHSREDGWASVASAVLSSGFSIVQAQPVKSEMSVAAPKSQTAEPIDLDVFLVCRKIDQDRRHLRSPEMAWEAAQASTRHKVLRFGKVGRRLSRSDVRVLLLSHLLVELCPGRGANEVNRELDELLPRSREAVDAITASQHVKSSKSMRRGSIASQTHLFEAPL